MGRLPRNLISIFRMENILPGQKITLNISDTNQPIFIKFHQNDRTMAGLLIFVSANLENVDQGQTLQKFSFLKIEYF